MEIDNYMAMGIEGMFNEAEKEWQEECDVICPECRSREYILPANSYHEWDYECLKCDTKIYVERG